MGKKKSEKYRRSRACWRSLEESIRQAAQEFVQEILEEEVAEFLGRERYERKKEVDPQAGYRNGYGKERKLTFMGGTMELRRPRVRGLEERFDSKVLPLFVRRTEEVSELLPQLYLHGLAAGDFDLALRGLLGEKAPLSGSTVARAKEKWEGEREEWNRRPLGGLEVVYLWADGLYVKAGLEKEKAAVLVIIGALADGSKVILYLGSGYRESTESWSEALRDLKSRGLLGVRLAVGDGHLGLWGALRNVYPQAKEQRCWNHRITNVLEKVPKRKQGEARELLTTIPYAQTLQKAEEGKAAFQAWCGKNGCRAAGELLEVDWDRMVTFYAFPKDHWKHLRTTNVVESPFASLRLRTDAAKRFRKVEKATAVIWRLLMVAERRFRRLDAPELLTALYQGVRFSDGVKVAEQDKGMKGAKQEESAA